MADDQGRQHYDANLRRRLPGTFVDDLTQALGKEGDPTGIGATVIPQKGVVAFVDEAIHHKTPTLEHRSVTPGSLKFVLKDRPAFKDAEEAYQGYKKRLTNFWGYASWLKLEDTKTNATSWFNLMEMLDQSGPSVKLDRPMLEVYKPAISDDDITAAVEFGGHSTVGRAQYFFMKGDKQLPEGSKITDVPVKKPGRPPLKRTISEQLIRGEQPKPATFGTSGRRTFFRTWIYALKQ